MHKSIGTSRDHAIIRAESWYKPCSYELVNRNQNQSIQGMSRLLPGLEY